MYSLARLISLYIISLLQFGSAVIIASARTVFIFTYLGGGCNLFSIMHNHKIRLVIGKSFS